MSYTVHKKNSDNAAEAKAALFTKKNSSGQVYEVVVADDRLLQIDYDYPYIPEHAYKTSQFLQERYPGRSIDCQVSTSMNGNRHLTIVLPEPMHVLERIAWQAIFGSDRKREALSLLAVNNDVKNPVLLYEPVDKSKITTLGALGTLPRLFKEE